MTSVVEGFRHSKPKSIAARSEFAEDVKSVSSKLRDRAQSQNTHYATAVPSQMNRTYNMTPTDDFKEVITSMTVNKGIGMTNGEWNEIVKRNVQKEKDEAQRQRDTLVK